MYYKNMSSLGKQNSIVPTPNQGQSMLGRRTHQQMQRSDSRPVTLGLVNPQRPEKRQKKNNDGSGSEDSLDHKRLKQNNDGDDSDEDADLFDDNEGPDEPPTPAQKKLPPPQAQIAQIKPPPGPQPMAQ